MASCIGVVGAREDPVLPGKLCPAEVQPEVLRRERLFRMLDDGLARGPVVVAGPAGFGKTQLVASWAQERRRPGRIAWLTLDSEDGEPEQFVRYMAAAIQGSSDPGERSDRTDAPHFTQLLRCMDSLDGELILVLDDFAEIAGSESEHLVQRLLQHPLRKLVLVILTRTDSDLARERLCLAGRLSDIRSTDLALTSEELTAVLTRRGLPLAEADVQLVKSRTAGWPAAVRLVASSLPHTHHVEEYLQGLPGSDPDLTDYLQAEVYGPHSPELRAFMDRICVVDRVCGDLACALTGEEDATEHLSDLARAQLVTRTHDDAGGWFEWTPLLAGFLRQQLSARSTRLERHLHRLAADWLLAGGRWGSGMEHVLAGRGARALAPLLSEHWMDLVISGESATLNRLFTSMDEEVVSGHSSLAVAEAFMAMRRDDLDLALGLVERAVTGSTTLRPPERRRVMLMASVVRLYAGALTGQADDGLSPHALPLLEETANESTLLTPVERVERALLQYQLGAFEASRGRYDAALDHVSAALTAADLLGLPYLELSCRAQLCLLHCQTGELELAQQQGRRVLDGAETAGWTSRYGLTVTHVGMAEVALVRDDLETAMDHLTKAESFIRPVDVLNRVRIDFLAASALCTAGKMEQADAYIDRLSRETAGRSLPTWVPQLGTSARARYCAFKGRPELGLRELQTPVVVGLGPSPVRPCPALLADLLLRCERPEEALCVVAGLSPGQYGTVTYVAAMVMKALAENRLGQQRYALNSLEEAVRVAAPLRIVQPFVAPGRASKPLLEALLDRGTSYDSAVVEILSHVDARWSGGSLTAARSPYFVDPLTERELEVLGRLQNRKSNAEIAAELFVSMNTLRTHLKSINRKLGAADRRDAVRRARDLQII